MKKRLSFVLISILCMSLVLTSCGGDKGSGNSAKGDNGGDLVWYMIGAAPTDLDMVMAEVSKITKEKIGVGVKMYQVANADYVRKIQTMVNSGETFDLCFINQAQMDNIRKGSFVELTDLIKTKGADMTKKIPEKVFDLAKIDGKLYGVPTYKEIAWQNTWMVNTRIAEKYNIDYKKELTTLEEMEPILQKVKDGEGDGFLPLMPYSAGMIGVLPYEFVGDTIFGVKLNYTNPTDVDHVIYNVYETPEAKKHLETMRRYYEKGFLPQDVTGTSDSEKKGAWFVNLNSYQPEYEVADSISKGYNIDVVYRHPPVMTNTVGAMNAIPVTCKRPEKAMEFLNLLNSDEQIRNMIGYGIEGVHYNLNDEGKRVVTDKGKEAYGSMPQYALGNLFLNKLAETDKDGKWERFEEYNNSAIESPIKGFFFDSKTVKSEVAAMENVISQYKKDLLFGRVDPDVILPEFLQKLKDVGSEKVQAEMQRQYDEFLKNKTK
ncbi:MAG: ABC transporter substrate-binding protein [Oscillospiraceae bacterium]